MTDKTDEKTTRNRLIYLIVGVLSVAVATVLLAVWWTTPNEEPTTPEITSQVEIDNQDQVLLSSRAKELLSIAGNFGVRPNTLTGDNIMNAQYLIASNPNQAKDFFVSRESAYAALKPHVFAGSPLSYDDRAVSQWTNQNELQNLTGYTVDSVSATTKKTGSYVNIGDKQHTAATVTVNFTSVATQRIQTINDSAWDGTFNVMEKTFANNTANLTFAKDGNGQWKLYSITDLKNQFLLATWYTPNSDAYANTQFDFKLIDTIKATTIPSDIPSNTPVATSTPSASSSPS